MLEPGAQLCFVLKGLPLSNLFARRPDNLFNVTGAPPISYGSNTCGWSRQGHVAGLNRAELELDLLFDMLQCAESARILRLQAPLKMPSLTHANAAALTRQEALRGGACFAKLRVQLAGPRKSPDLRTISLQGMAASLGLITELLSRTDLVEAEKREARASPDVHEDIWLRGESNPKSRPTPPTGHYEADPAHQFSARRAVCASCGLPRRQARDWLASSSPATICAMPCAMRLVQALRPSAAPSALSGSSALP